MFRVVNAKRGEAAADYNIANIYYKQNQLEEAIEYLTRCIELDKQVQHPVSTRNQTLLAEWQQEFADKP
jgi:tetratricopeptide (TPR) repeat protein